MKDKTTALLLSIFGGILGFDRFYLGYVGLGILKLLTAGCFGILALVDLFRIAKGSLGPKDGSPYLDVAAYKTILAQAGADDAARELEKLSILYTSGALKEEEYNRLKAEHLAKL